ncbi:GNAT family N-acetyltransferase [Luteimonas kalidii]|uniref:GNAT family protein n=1 Tax=Luteimonas kalidii TaxID=3042025 RepID=A0ABT6JVG4_9GAMM|nr:GNAT family protein [Luteimonas kalidii]MDH5834166.1 GNAT family protein [Luteimonas kalidii]
MSRLETLPAPWRSVPRLVGRHAVLEPLQAAHADGLRAVVEGSGLEALWYTHVPAPGDMDTYVAGVLDAQAQGRVLPFAVRDPGGALVGCTRFYGLEPEVPKLLIGYTWYAPHVQRTGINTECKRMLLEHAFDTLRCVNVSFETSWFNHASRAAIARLGAKQDGVLRNAKRHEDGSLRDTVVFSILDTEWPAVRRHLQARLDAHA